MYNVFNPMVKSVKPGEAHENSQNGLKVIYVDVRGPEEYAAGHIPGAVNIEVSRIRDAKKMLPDISATYYVYCQRGIRSARACAVMQDMGYINAYDMGAISDWEFEIV